MRVVLDASSPFSRGCVCSVGRSVIRPHSRVGNRPGRRICGLIDCCIRGRIRRFRVRRAGALGVARGLVRGSGLAVLASVSRLVRLGASTERATTATASPPLGVTNFTPIVERPVGRKSSLIGLRTTWPPWVIESTSSPSTTMKAPTRPPRSSLASDIALMPRPPRDCRR